MAAPGYSDMWDSCLITACLVIFMSQSPFSTQSPSEERRTAPTTAWRNLRRDPPPQALHIFQSSRRRRSWLLLWLFVLRQKTRPDAGRRGI